MVCGVAAQLLRKSAMFLVHKTYALTTQLSHTDVLVRISALLRIEEGARVAGGGGRLPSEFAADIGIKPYMLRYDRWLGINSFTWATDVFVRTIPHDGVSTRVFVEVNRFRPILWVVLVAIYAGILARAKPLPVLVISIVLAGAAAWLLCVSWLAGYRIIDQIRKALAVEQPRSD